MQKGGSLTFTLPLFYLSIKINSSENKFFADKGNKHLLTLSN